MRSQNIKEVFQGLWPKGEQAIADRQRELNGVQIQAQSLRKKLHKYKRSNPAVDFALDFARMAVSNKQ